jgi:hypothetical protein
MTTAIVMASARSMAFERQEQAIATESWLAIGTEKAFATA